MIQNATENDIKQDWFLYKISYHKDKKDDVLVDNVIQYFVDSNGNDYRIIIENPTIPVHVHKDKTQTYRKQYDKQENFEKVINVSYMNREREIAKIINKEQQYKTLMYSARNSEKDRERFNKFKQNEIYGCPYLYNTDCKIDNFKHCYHSFFNNKQTLPLESIKKLKISFFDIEVRSNIKNNNEMYTHHNPQGQISTITHLSYSGKIYLFYLDDNFQNNGSNEIAQNPNILLNYLKNSKDYMIYRDKKLVNICDVYEHEFRFFKTEKELIDTYMDFIYNVEGTHILSAYNFEYDINYIYYRYKLMYGNPDLLFNNINDKNYNYIRSEYKEDRSKDIRINKAQETKDYFETPGSILFVCSMRFYGCSRVKTDLPNFKLDTVAEEELGIKKIDLALYGYHVSNVEYKNLLKHLEYSLKDTILLQELENKVHDIRDTLMGTLFTPIHNYFKLSHNGRNVITFLGWANGLIVSGNYDPTSYEDMGYVYQKAPGAFVADTNNMKFGGMKTSNGDSLVFNWVIDKDFSAWYPSTARVFNLDPEYLNWFLWRVRDELTNEYFNFKKTKIEIDLDIATETDYYDHGKHLSSCLIERDFGGIEEIVETCFELPNISTMIKEIENELKGQL